MSVASLDNGAAQAERSSRPPEPGACRGASPASTRRLFSGCAARTLPPGTRTGTRGRSASRGRAGERRGFELESTDAPRLLASMRAAIARLRSGGVLGVVGASALLALSDRLRATGLEALPAALRGDGHRPRFAGAGVR